MPARPASRSSASSGFGTSRATRAHDVETHRRRGELFLAMGKADEAEAAWLRAIEIARLQETKTLELRAAVDLARLWHDQGKHSAARDLLPPVYGWFTEGLATAELKDAKALLDALG
jgi:predicted ATPase